MKSTGLTPVAFSTITHSRVTKFNLSSGIFPSVTLGLAMTDYTTKSYQETSLLERTVNLRYVYGIYE